MESVTCSSAEMTDGDLKTFGSSGHQILIELPERKSIHRIVIHQTNIEDLILYTGARETGEKLPKSKITAKPLLKSDKPLLPTGSECESMGRWTTCGLRLNT